VLLHQFFLAAANGNPGFQGSAYSDDGHRRKRSCDADQATQEANMQAARQLFET
jgi:hypothetical protein